MIDVSPSARALAALVDLIHEVNPDVIAQVGDEAVARFLASGSPTLLADYDLPGVRRDTSGNRPSDAAADALSSQRVLVCLVDLAPAAVFAWASLLRAGSAIAASGLREALDLSRISCTAEAKNGWTVIRPVERPSTQDPPAPSRRPRSRRPLRSVFLGDLTYCSAYRFGVQQGMTLLGAWHRDVSIRDDAAAIDRQVREMRPDLIFTHMFLWPPANGQAAVYDLLDMAEIWRRGGAVVLVHDGDPRSRTRYPHDVSRSVDLALLNHARPVAEWNVPTVRWPYAAFVQEAIGAPLDDLRCDLAFTGRMREDGLYGPRSACVRALVDRVGLRVFPGQDGINSRMLVADVAASAAAMVGFGRPEVPGWIDTRVFEVPGAGGVLIHDDVGGLLEPGLHYVPCQRYDVDSVIAALETAKRDGDRLRAAAFAHVQAHHTWRHRCREIVELFYGQEGQ